MTELPKNSSKVLHIGDDMPQFQVFDGERNLISSQDFLGTPVVIYFYPQDETPGCTKEACDFRDMMDELDARGVIVIGISPDSYDSHKRFTEKHELNFELLSDPKLEIAHLFGAICHKKSGTQELCIERATYLIDETGKIAWIEKPVKVDGHAMRVLKALDSLKPF